MIKDKNLEANMELYIQVMQERYDVSQKKKNELESLLNRSASKIQKIVRSYFLKKKTISSIMIQRWWRKIMKKRENLSNKIYKFRYFFYGTIIAQFLKKRITTKNNEIKILKTQESKNASNEKFGLIKLICSTFPVLIIKKSSLFAEYKYISKYRLYLKNKFENDWKIYEEKISKEMKKEINRKWVKIESKGSKQMYLNERDQEVCANDYVTMKLDKMYEEVYNKMENTDHDLQESQNKIMFAIQLLENNYANCAIEKLKFSKTLFTNQ